MTKLTLKNTLPLLFAGITAAGCSTLPTPRIPDHCQNFEPNNVTFTTVRLGAEPADGHFFGRNTPIDNFIEDTLGIKGGLGAGINHLYIEFGNTDDNGDFIVGTRIHSFSIDKNGTQAIELGGRAFTLVVDGTETLFSDDPIYTHDPHKNLCGQLQSATENFWFGEDATKNVFSGTEIQNRQLYAALLHAVIELNNQDLDFFALGHSKPIPPFPYPAPNGNSKHFALKSVLKTMAKVINMPIDDHNPSGWDVGKSYKLEMNNVPYEYIAGMTDLDTLNDHIKKLEKAASGQFQILRNSPDPTAVDLNTPHLGL